MIVLVNKIYWGRELARKKKQEKYLNFPMTIPNAITNICTEKVFFKFIPNTKVKRKDELNTKSLGLFNYLKSAQTHHREGNGNPLQYSCLENPMDRGAW